MIYTNKKISGIFSAILLFISFYLSFYYFQLAGIQKNFISEYINFSSKFSFLNTLFHIFILFFLSIYWFNLGRFVIKKLNLQLPASFTIAIGLVIFNIIIFPLFFFNLLTELNLWLLFLFLTAIVVKELSCEKKSLKIHYPKFFIVSSLIIFIPHLFNAISPVNFGESFGDIANIYLAIPMNFAANHGAVHNHLLAVSLAQFDNFELISSALIMLSNPEIIKLFGLLLLFLSYWMLSDVISMVFSKTSIWVSILLITIPYFLNIQYFSFAHPRIYVMFLSSLSIYLILLKKKNNFSYFPIILLVIAVLSATSYQGLLAGLILFFTLFLNTSFKNILLNYKKLFPVFILFLLIILAFPIWIGLNQGSPFPIKENFNKVFKLTVIEDFVSPYTIERVSLLSESSKKLDLGSWMAGIIKIIYEQVNLSTLLLLLVLVFIKNKKILNVLIFYLLNNLILLFMFPNSIDGGGRARFLWIYSPFLVFLIAAFCYEVNIRIPILLFKTRNLSIKVNKKLFLKISDLILIFLIRFFVFKTIVFIFKIIPWISKYLYLNTWSFLGIIVIFSFILTKLINCKKPAKFAIINFCFLLVSFSYIFQKHNLYSLPIIKNFLVLSPSFLQVVILVTIFSVADIWFELKEKTRLFFVNLFQGFFPLIIHFSIIFLVTISLYKNLDLIYNEYSESGQFSKQLEYFLGKISLGDFLEYRPVAVSKVLNKNFNNQDKILYLFQAQGIYAKPILYQANVTIGSIIYRTADKQKILSTLNKEGIKYLVIDNKWGISDDISLSIPADINSAIFEPDFFVKHFVLINDEVQSLYIFKIYNQEVTPQLADKNFENIRKSGFFSFLFYGVNNKSKAIRLKANPNSISVLQNKLKKIEELIYPYPGDYFQNCKFCCYRKI